MLPHQSNTINIFKYTNDLQKFICYLLKSHPMWILFGAVGFIFVKYEKKKKNHRRQPIECVPMQKRWLAAFAYKIETGHPKDNHQHTKEENTCESRNCVLSFNYCTQEIQKSKMSLTCKPFAQKHIFLEVLEAIVYVR